MFRGLPSANTSVWKKQSSNLAQEESNYLSYSHLKISRRKDRQYSSAYML